MRISARFFSASLAAMALAISISSVSQTLHAQEPDSQLDAPQKSDAELCDFFKGLYEKTPQDAAERYAVNRIPENMWHGAAFKALAPDSKASPGAKAAARKELGDIRDLIKMGQAWPIKEHEACEIPRAAAAPELDGDFDAPAWKKALVFKDEYHLDSVEKKASGSEWRVMWDDKYLYFEAWLPDSGIISYDYKPRSKCPWDGDCLEIFVLPSMRLKNYWELVINPKGSVFDGLHRNSPSGGFISNPADDIAGLKKGVKIVKDESGADKGYVVQAAMPFDQMPNYMLGNKPAPGQTLYFTMVRTENGQRHSPRPLLYDGHNIFGFLKATLVE